jgi:hypothetical protein
MRRGIAARLRTSRTSGSWRKTSDGAEAIALLRPARRVVMGRVCLRDRDSRDAGHSGNHPKAKIVAFTSSAATRIFITRSGPG